ncbi:MAG: fluoride efflux transporter CrcB [Sphingobium sp.]
MFQTILVMSGGAIGAALRYHVGRLSLRLFGSGWPWGTLAVNVAGGLAMGLLAGWLVLREGAEPLRLFLAVGVLGGFTTFSSFSLEMMQMIQRGAVGSALSYALVSVIASVGALGLGLALTRTAA